MSVFIGQAEQKSKQIDRLINSPATSVPPLQVVHRVLFFSSVYLRLFWFARQWQQENVGEVLATGMSDMRRAILSWPRATILPIDGFLPATATPLPPPPSGEKEKIPSAATRPEERNTNLRLHYHMGPKSAATRHRRCHRTVTATTQDTSHWCESSLRPVLGATNERSAACTSQDGDST